ncbi:MAG: alpha/beta hydrolase [Promethearchaeota archaeon]|nr:MAG: alpha/beta hydrolase [Candidatus Lokiarchaeota archaeon]
MTEFFAEVNGIKLCYEIHGEGEPIFLVHGYGGKKLDWFTQIPVLSEKFKVITFDNRCSGKSERPNKPITMEMFAEDLKGLMDFLKINKAHIIGRSLGGMIVQFFTLKYPERINKLVLINTSYGGVMGDVIKNSTLEELADLKKDPAQAFWNSTRFLFHQKFRKQLEKQPNRKFYNLFSAENLINNISINPPNAEDLINQANAFDGFDILDRLSEIVKPTLLIAASHDRILPKSGMEIMSEKIPNNELKIIEKAGHGSPISRASEINALIIDFLNK